MTQTRSIYKTGDYKDFYEIDYVIFHETNSALMACHNVEDFAFVFEKYGENMTDFQLGYTLEYIATHNLPRTPQFWSDILPKIKDQVPKLDRECT
jgi:hypothetical protein